MSAVPREVWCNKWNIKNIFFNKAYPIADFDLYTLVWYVVIFCVQYSNTNRVGTSNLKLYGICMERCTSRGYLHVTTLVGLEATWHSLTFYMQQSTRLQILKIVTHARGLSLVIGSSTAIITLGCHWCIYHGIHLHLSWKTFFWFLKFWNRFQTWHHCWDLF